MPTGSKQPRSSVPKAKEKAVCVVFRKHTLLPLDDYLYTLLATMPHLTRSSLLRYFKRHGISRLPDVTGDKPNKRQFKAYQIGYFHLDLAEVDSEESKFYLLVAIDCTAKFALAWLDERANGKTSCDFLEALVDCAPYKIDTVLTDNGIQFADLQKNFDGPTRMPRGHPFGRSRWRHGIERRLTNPYHSWTNGHVERMNRTIKEAPVKSDTVMSARTN